MVGKNILVINKIIKIMKQDNKNIVRTKDIKLIKFYNRG